MELKTEFRKLKTELKNTAHTTQTTLLCLMCLMCCIFRQIRKKFQDTHQCFGEAHDYKRMGNRTDQKEVDCI